MRKLIKAILWTAGILALIGVVLRLTVLDVWTVPDDPRLAAAMGPTLQAGDVVLMLSTGAPEFGELVRCPDPETPQSYVVGRIAGFENDVVEIENGTLTVNNKRYGSESSCPKSTFTVPHPSSGSKVELTCDVVSMGGGWHYRGTAQNTSSVAKTHTQVGRGMVYLLSDDRAYHDDSRDFGTIVRASCKERVLFRLWGKSGFKDTEHRFTYIH
jgi:signal peptidase I